jgi:hypothetical protein
MAIIALALVSCGKQGLRKNGVKVGVFSVGRDSNKIFFILFIKSFVFDGTGFKGKE